MSKTADGGEAEVDPRDALATYLQDRLDGRDEPLRTKSKHLADRLPLSAVQIGTILGEWRQDPDAPVDVTTWGGKRHGCRWVVREPADARRDGGHDGPTDLEEDLPEPRGGVAIPLIALGVTVIGTVRFAMTESTIMALVKSAALLVGMMVFAILAVGWLNRERIFARRGWDDAF